MPYRSRLVILMLGVSLTAAATWSLKPLRAQEVKITSAWSSHSISPDKRMRTKKFGKFPLVVFVDGDLAPGEAAAVRCTARVFDGTARDGLPKRRSKVKVQFQGEVLDALTGNTVQEFRKKSTKTDKNGDAVLEFLLEDQSEIYAVLTGSMKKKKSTGAFFTCTAAAATENATFSLASSRGRPRESTQFGVEYSFFGGETFRVSNEDEAFDTELPETLVEVGEHSGEIGSVVNFFELRSCAVFVFIRDHETNDPLSFDVSLKVSVSGPGGSELQDSRGLPSEFGAGTVFVEPGLLKIDPEILDELKDLIEHNSKGVEFRFEPVLDDPLQVLPFDAEFSVRAGFSHYTDGNP